MPFFHFCSFIYLSFHWLPFACHFSVTLVLSASPLVLSFSFVSPPPCHSPVSCLLLYLSPRSFSSSHPLVLSLFPQLPPCPCLLILLASPFPVSPSPATSLSPLSLSVTHTSSPCPLFPFLSSYPCYLSLSSLPVSPTLLLSKPPLLSTSSSQSSPRPFHVSFPLSFPFLPTSFPCLSFIPAFPCLPSPLLLPLLSLLRCGEFRILLL
jgi:hypothetical protein